MVSLGVSGVRFLATEYGWFGGFGGALPSNRVGLVGGFGVRFLATEYG